MTVAGEIRNKAAFPWVKSSTSIHSCWSRGDALGRMRGRSGLIHTLTDIICGGIIHIGIRILMAEALEGFQSISLKQNPYALLSL